MIYYVSQKSKSCGSGTRGCPFRTISEAAQIAAPGDTVMIDDGIYREWVAPKNGGLGNHERITYMNMPGTHPVVSGAEVVDGWIPMENNIWKISISNAFFGNYNPYADEIYGDWYDGLGQIHHTGEVFADGEALYEAASLEALFHPASDSKKALRWFACVNDGETEIYADFGEKNPSEICTEISVRPFCFFPGRTGLNYITVSGLTFCQAATQWAPPTAFQPAAVGPNWSKGWIIENCCVHHSKCSGISLGKKADVKDNSWSKDPSKGGAQTYTEMIFSTLSDGWSRENVGGHIVRNNEIYECGQTGIVGCMGAVYSDITGNHIHHINRRGEIGGAEMAGIKLHAAIDVVIEQNCIHDCPSGVWLDWEAQGAAVRRNSFFKNVQDLFIEVCHGPCTVENNLFLSEKNFFNASQGTACVHNIFAGEMAPIRDINRFTLYHLPHSTMVGGVMFIYGGDDQFYNNIFVGKNDGNPSLGTNAYKKYTGTAEKKGMENDTPMADIEKTFPVKMKHNVYFNQAKSWEHEMEPRIISDFEAELSVQYEDGHYVMYTNLYEKKECMNAELITTEILGKAFESDQYFENRDGSSLVVDRDFTGAAREEQTTAGPFQNGCSRMVLI